MPFHRLAISCPLLLASFFIGCDGTNPTEAPIEEGIEAGSTSALKAPSSMTAAAVSENQIDIAWQDNSSNESGFEVQRAMGGASSTFSAIQGLGAGTTSYSDGGLTPSAQYCYKVRAFRIIGNKTIFSALSAAACATTPAAPLPPLPIAPSSIDAIPTRSTEVGVLWSDNSNNQARYRVERSTDEGATWSSAGTTSTNVHVLWDAGRTPEQQVCYRVFAFNLAGDSPPSDSDCTTPPLGPTNLTAAVVDPVTLEVSLAWTDNSAVEDGYRVGACFADGTYCSWVADVPANSTSYQFFTWGDPYQEAYTVAAMKDGGTSDWSDLASPIRSNSTP